MSKIVAGGFAVLDSRNGVEKSLERKRKYLKPNIMN